MTDEDAEGILNERIKELEEEIKKALMELEEQGLEPWKKREQRNKLKDLDGERNMLNNAMMMDSASKQRIAGKVLASKANTIAAETMNARARDGGVLAIGANGNGGSGNSVFAVAGPPATPLAMQLYPSSVPLSLGDAYNHGFAAARALMTPMQPTTSYGEGCQFQIHHGCTTHNVTEHHHHNAASQDAATASQVEGLLIPVIDQLKTVQGKVEKVQGKVEEVQEKVEEAASAAKKTKRLVEMQSDKPKKRKVKQSGEEHESTRRKCRTDAKERRRLSYGDKERRRLSYGDEASVPRVVKVYSDSSVGSGLTRNSMETRDTILLSPFITMRSQARKDNGRQSRREARFLEQAAMRDKWIHVSRAPKAGDHVMVMKEGQYKGKVGTYGGRGGWVGGLIEGSTMNVQILIKDLQVVEESR